MATSTTSQAKKTIGRRELVVMIALAMSLNALAVDGMLPALDIMSAELGASGGNDRQLVVGVFILANGIGCLVPGAYADRFGRRPLMLFSLISYAVLSFAVALVQDFNMLLGLRFVQGILSAGLIVVPHAVIRDQYEGDRMAQLMSLISAVFIMVPIVAPSIGQAVMLIAGWRWIFIGMSMLAVVATVWIWLRLPETLAPENRQEIHLPVVVRNMYASLINRESIGYVLGTAFVLGGVFGYVNSAQQLLGEHFGAGEWFPVLFGATAGTMMISSLINSRIVERFGARRVSHAGVLIYIAASIAQIFAAHFDGDNLALFLPLMSINLGMLGFLGANFGSIAMQPFAKTAGAASSAQTFFRMVLAAVGGIAIGQAYDGTALPFAYALLICGVGALLCVLYSEKGRLFQRRNPPKSKQRAS